MSDTTIYPAVIDVLDAGTPAIRAFREAKGETLTGLAAATAIDVSRLTDIEAGETPTSLEIAYLAVALSVDDADLIAALQ